MTRNWFGSNVVRAFASATCVVVVATAIAPVAHAAAIEAADSPLAVAALEASSQRDAGPSSRGYVRFKPWRKAFPIGSWRSRGGTHKVKVVVLYSQSLIPLSEVVHQTQRASQLWAREIPGMDFRFGSPSAKRVSTAVVCNPEKAWKSELGKKRNFAKKKHVLVVSPECGSEITGWGVGTIGKGSGRAFSAGNNGDIFAHELGHNLGLPHENGLSCTNTRGVRVPLSKRCRELEYDDDGTLMGAGSSVQEIRLGPVAQGLLTRNAVRIKNGTNQVVTISNAGGPGVRLAVVKGSFGSLLFDMAPGRSWNPEVFPAGLQARLVTKEGAGLLTLPDPQGAMSSDADSTLEAGESWVIPGTGMRATVLDARVEEYLTVRFSPA